MTIKITKTSWRPFIELHAVPKNEGDFIETLYFDVTKRPLIVQTEAGTVLHFGDNTTVLVQESVKDILKAVEKLIKDEQDAKAEQAKKYMAETQARVAAFKEGSN